MCVWEAAQIVFWKVSAFVSCHLTLSLCVEAWALMTDCGPQHPVSQGAVRRAQFSLKSQTSSIQTSPYVRGTNIVPVCFGVSGLKSTQIQSLFSEEGSQIELPGKIQGTQLNVNFR